jgi:hypothetical protein
MLGLANVIVDAFAKTDWQSLEHEVHSLHKDCIEQHSIRVVLRRIEGGHAFLHEANKESSLATQEGWLTSQVGCGGLDGFPGSAVPYRLESIRCQCFGSLEPRHLNSNQNFVH